ncbi:hypothetical protein [Candidatus Pristimantibacillus sp. PTI5]|uniref:hypothetical protein n=1 Tax=Candidatus Pristimantibacillus sp. PTI5 TaxID=3400422 RepID=UPI003B01A079
MEFVQDNDNMSWQAPAVHREKLSLNQEWRFFRGEQQGAEASDFDDSAWELVHLPLTVRIEPADCSGGINYLGVAWYRRHFYVDKVGSGQKYPLNSKARSIPRRYGSTGRIASRIMAVICLLH